jgi:hypothetical protein
MSLGTLLLIVVVLLLIGVLPTWGYSNSWGCLYRDTRPCFLLIVIVLLLMGRL